MGYVRRSSVEKPRRFLEARDLTAAARRCRRRQGCDRSPFRLAARRLPLSSHPRSDDPLQVLVRDNNVDQALRVLKKKMQREGVFKEMKQRRAFEKPSEKRTREKAEAIRRARKLARKKAQREGLLPAPKRKVPAGRPRAAAIPSLATD